MPALYPSTVAPEDFSIGDTVKKYFDGSQISPYTGIVTSIVPSTYKVWVKWPIGGDCQEDPEVLLKINPATQPFTPVNTDPSGYNSHEKNLSEKYFGTVRPRIIEAARRLAGTDALLMSKMASRVARKFAEEVVDSVVGDILTQKESGMSDIQAYDEVYKKYANTCSDVFLRSTITKVYASTEA